MGYPYPSVVFLTRYIDDERGKQKVANIRETRPTSGKVNAPKKGSPPSEGRLKINVDGAFIKETEAAEVGIIIRDHIGKASLTAWRWVRHGRDAYEAEALACLEGIRLAAKWSRHDMVLEVDCSRVIETFKLGGVNSQQLQSLNFAKVRREQNKVAHELAHLALRSN
uniref:RNase H type-1 domain-containing protein n=1 Tax=Setaria italica TaxID=4555 RepID=K3XQD1_SETIT